jgi:hypothetical protein
MENSSVFYVFCFFIAWAPCQRDMTRIQLVDGGDGLKVSRDGPDLLKRTISKSRQGVILTLGVLHGAKNPLH